MPVSVRNYLSIVSGKNGPPDHFMPILVDRVKVLVFCLLHKISHSGEGWFFVKFGDAF
jgi:hypothetical protein